jgi:hypothetical protein
MKDCKPDSKGRQCLGLPATGRRGSHRSPIERAARRTSLRSDSPHQALPERGHPTFRERECYWDRSADSMRSRLHSKTDRAVPSDMKGEGP